MNNSNAIPSLWTRNFILAISANFLQYFGFFALMPIIPIFLMKNYDIAQSHTGVILASYTFSALVARPISAYFADLYNRKKLFLGISAIYSLIFIPLPFIKGIALFIIVRIFHGLLFGGISVVGNAFNIDIIPEKRRGEGIGFIGVSNSLGLALGPTAGFYIYQATNSFVWVFMTTFIFTAIALIVIWVIRLPKNSQRIERTTENMKITFDKIYQIKGVMAGFALFMVSSPYGLITSFAVIYGQELGIITGLGEFFAFYATGLIISRIISGKLVDGGKITHTIVFGSFMASFVLLMFSSIGWWGVESIVFIKTLFYISALLLGFSYGVLFPAYNVLFVNLAPDNRRAAAASTYLTNWDMGLGMGLILGGFVMEKFGLSVAYFVGAFSALSSAIFFTVFVVKDFQKKRLR